MPQWIDIQARDGHRFSAWQDGPAGQARAGVVLLQEVFGVNPHIRAVAARLAQAGLRVLAPALFDRVERGCELDYDAAGLARGRELVARLGWDDPLRDVAACKALLQRELPVFALGFCWGGTLAALCATRLGLPAIGYYGARSEPFLHEHPQAPMLLHFGRRDPLFPMDKVDALRAAWPQAEVHIHEAGHGFNCDARADYDADAAAAAWGQSLAFIERCIGRRE